MSLELALGLAWVALLVSWSVVYRDRDDQDDVEAAREQYVEGEIDLDELERRLELELDDSAQEIRQVVEPVEGVGPSKSAALARRFDSVQEVERADVEELQEVPGVGPQLSQAIEERLGS